MNIGRRGFLKSLALVGAIATMGFLGCMSTPEPTPTPTSSPTPKPPESKSTPTQKQTTRTFFVVGTELKPCPECGAQMFLQDVYGVLWWVCQDEDCGYAERVTEPEILRKYGYTDQLKSIENRQ